MPTRGRYGRKWRCRCTQPAAEPQASVIGSLLDRAAGGKWEAFEPPGEGKDWRLEDEQLTGSSLVWEEKVVIHMQLFPEQATASGAGEARTFRPRIRRR